jgi:hypothetical protein
MARAFSRAYSWTSADEAKLREIYATTNVERLAEIFGRSKKAVNSRAKVLGLRKAIGHGGKTEWTESLDRELRRLYPDTHTDELARRLNVSVLALYDRAQKLGIRKSAAYVERKRCEERKRLMSSGVAHRFHKGQTPPNKGLRRPGYSIGRGRMRETQFKKGQVSRNVMPLWAFRWVDGYLALKTGKPGPKPMDGWEYVHKLIWEQANGPLPDWHEARIWWKDGDHANCSLSNLELIKGSDHVARTTVHNLPKPLVQVIQLAGALKRKIRNREKKLNGQEHIAGSAGPSFRDARGAV